MRKALLAIACLAAFNSSYAGDKKDHTINMNLTHDSAKSVGSITFKDSPYGLLIIPNLKDLPPGPHGFHVHEKPDCGDKGLAAGGHLDPKKTETHQGPYVRKSHLGDLPVLYVNKDGTAKTPILAPRLKVKQVKKHAIMIHAGGDNYSDEPKLGGGGARMACGVDPDLVKKEES